MKQSIALAGLRNYAKSATSHLKESWTRTWDAVVVTEGLELAFGPSVEDPVSNVAVGSLGLVLGLIPSGLNLSYQGILALFGRVLGLKTLELEVGGQLLGVPVLIRCDDVAVPVLLDELLEITAVRRSRIRDIVV